MIAFVTITTQYSSIPIQNHVMIKAETHGEIVAVIGKMGDDCAKSLDCNGCEYSVESFDMKRENIDSELHYLVKLLIKH